MRSSQYQIKKHWINQSFSIVCFITLMYCAQWGCTDELCCLQEDRDCTEISLRPVSTSNPGVRVSTLVNDGHTDALSHVLMMEGGNQSDLSDPVSRKSLKLNTRPRDNDSAKESSQSDETSGRGEGVHSTQ